MLSCAIRSASPKLLFYTDAFITFTGRFPNSRGQGAIFKLFVTFSERALHFLENKRIIYVQIKTGELVMAG